MKLTIPNLLSVLRMGLVPLFVLALIDGDNRRALLIFLLAGVTDSLDGFVARFYKQQSVLGSFLDPAADKILLTAGYLVLAMPTVGTGPWIPLWVTILVIVRDVLIVTMALVLYLKVGTRRFPPALISKLTTTSQMVTVLVVLLARNFDVMRGPATILIYLTAALTLASGINYILLAVRMAREGAAEGKAEQPSV